VSDFGVAKTLSKRLRRHRQAGGAGTPAYMAPEQAMADPRSITGGCFAVGVLGTSAHRASAVYRMTRRHSWQPTRRCREPITAHRPGSSELGAWY
jgi:serine/threonine protein kinase